MTTDKPVGLNEEMLRRKSIALVGAVDEAELCIRMLEAAQGVTRPKGQTAAQALSGLDRDSQRWLRAQARAALVYMSECFAKGVRPQ